MTVVDWAASDAVSWTLFVVGALTAILPVVVSARWVRFYALRRYRYHDLWLHLALRTTATAGAFLLVFGIVLSALRPAAKSWMAIAAGGACLVMFGFFVLLYRIRRLHDAERHEVYAFGTGGAASRRAPRTMPVSIAQEVVRELRPHLTAQPPSTRDAFDRFADSMVRAGTWAPVSIYTSADDGAELKAAVTAVLAEFGLRCEVEQPPVPGSWFQRFWARSSDSESVRSRVRKLEQAVELEYLGKARAEIDRSKAESVAALLGAIGEQENAVVRIGSIIATKAQGDLAVWTIGEMEAAALERNSHLLGDPVAALEFLRGVQETGAGEVERPGRAPGPLRH